MFDTKFSRLLGSVALAAGLAIAAAAPAHADGDDWHHDHGRHEGWYHHRPVVVYAQPGVVYAPPPVVYAPPPVVYAPPVVAAPVIAVPSQLNVVIPIR